MNPTRVETRVGEVGETRVVIDVANPPDGFFCPRGTQVSGVALHVIEFPQGCTASGTGDATLQVLGRTAGEAVIEIVAHAADGTPADGTALVTVTVTP